MASGSPFQLIDILSSHNVPFVMIGGHAVTFHGYVRATEDTDIVYQRSDEAVEQLFASAISQGSHKYVSLAWLRKMKSAASRPKDQLDLENLPD